MRRPRAAARLAAASLLVAAAVGCKRARPLRALPEPAADFPLTVQADTKDADSAGAATAPAARPADPEGEPLLTKQKLSPELRKLVAAAHAHRAVGSLEAAGCDEALVMTGAKFNRLADLRHGGKMPAQVDDPQADVIWCDRRTGHGPDCADLAPIFARVAHPRRPFEVFTAWGAPPFSPRCWGRHDKTGRYIFGGGRGYPSREPREWQPEANQPRRRVE